MFIRLGVILVYLLLIMPVGAEPTLRQVTVLFSPSDEIQQHFFQAFQRQLTGLGKSVKILPGSSGTASLTGDLVVAVGARACLEVLNSQSTLPLVCALVPRLAVAKALAMHRGQATALYLDQPFERQLRLLKLVLPRAQVVGFLAGPISQQVEPELAKAVLSQGLQLYSQPYRSGDNIVTVLQRFNSVNAMLAYPDPVVFSPENIYPLLLTTYHQNIPTLGFSNAFVDAGALSAVFSTPEQLGDQTAETVTRWLASGQLPDPQYPRQFTVRTNAQVARSLRLTLPSEQDLQRQLIAWEQRP